MTKTKEKKLKVYGWRSFRSQAPGSHQTREVVAATSLAAAARAAGYERPSQLDLLCETGNVEEIRQALTEPGTVFWQSLNTDMASKYLWWRSDGSLAMRDTVKTITVDVSDKTALDAAINELKAEYKTWRRQNHARARAEDTSDRDVHTEHCCKEHGCKYSDRKCTVVTGKKIQSFIWDIGDGCCAEGSFFDQDWDE